MTGNDDVKNTVDTAICRADELISQNKDGEAIKVLQEAIEPFGIADECLELARICDTLGRMLLGAGDLKKALQYYSRSLIIKQRELGMVHRELAVAYRNIAACIPDEQAAAKKWNLEQAETMELPEEEFHLLKQYLLTDDDLAKLSRKQ